MFSTEMMFIMLVILLILQFCDGDTKLFCQFLDLDCPDDAMPISFAREKSVVLSTWIHNTTLEMVSEYKPSVILCAIMASVAQMYGMLYFPDGKCVVFLSMTNVLDGSDAGAAYKMTKTGQNIALGKDITSSAVLAPIYGPTNLVDGNFDNEFAGQGAAAGIFDPWVLLDLGAHYSIRCIVITSDWRMKDTQVKVGNTLVTDGDFSTYEDLGFIDTSSPAGDLGYGIFPLTETKYKYVSAQFMTSIWYKSFGFHLRQLDVYSTD